MSARPPTCSKASFKRWSRSCDRRLGSLDVGGADRPPRSAGEARSAIGCQRASGRDRSFRLTHKRVHLRRAQSAGPSRNLRRRDGGGQGQPSCGEHALHVWHAVVARPDRRPGRSAGSACSVVGNGDPGQDKSPRACGRDRHDEHDVSRDPESVARRNHAWRIERRQRGRGRGRPVHRRDRRRHRRLDPDPRLMLRSGRLPPHARPRPIRGGRCDRAAVARTHRSHGS